MFEANQIVAETLSMLQAVAEAGMTTFELDRLAEELCLRRKARPAFKGYSGFPASLCVSLNEQVVHGIPSRKCKLRNGDILSIDFGVEYQGFFGDSAISFAIGQIDDQRQRLLQTTDEALTLAISQVQVGKRIVDISRAVQDHVEPRGFSVVRQFVGHGIGRSLHEGPEIPNYVSEGQSPRLQEGMVLAIEPMINLGTEKVKVLRDGWTVVTADKKCSAHFEHSVALTADGPLVLSNREQFMGRNK